MLFSHPFKLCTVTMVFSCIIFLIWWRRRIFIFLFFSEQKNKKENHLIWEIGSLAKGQNFKWI